MLTPLAVSKICSGCILMNYTTNDKVSHGLADAPQIYTIIIININEVLWNDV